MAQIIYQIVTGTPNFTASIVPFVSPNQVLTELGVYSFDDIPEDVYTLTVIDSQGCTSVNVINLVPPTTTTTSSTTSSTTTTTTTQYPIGNSLFYVTSAGAVYSYDHLTNTSVYLFNSISGYDNTYTGTLPVDIAVTQGKMWISFSGNSYIREFNITVNPFTYIFVRDIHTSTSYVNGGGLSIKSTNNISNIYKLVSSNALTSIITEITISPSGGTTSALFTMSGGGYVTGDILYNAITDTYILTKTIGSSYYITEYNNTGDIIVNKSASVDSLYGLYQYSSLTYTIRANRQVYRVDGAGLVLINTLSGSSFIQGSAQDINNITGNLPANPPTTTTTSTSSTTTTTTTPLPTTTTTTTVPPTTTSTTTLIPPTTTSTTTPLPTTTTTTTAAPTTTTTTLFPPTTTTTTTINPNNIFYIAPAPAGSNSNLGTINSPWLTLKYATTQVITAGKMIHIKEGSYTENQQCTLSPGVSIEGEGVTKSIVHCAKTDNYTILMYSASVTNGNQQISNIAFVGDMIGFGALSFVRRSNVNIHHCSFTDLVTTAIYTDNTIPTTTFTTGNQVHDCTFTNCAVYSAGGSIGAINIRGQQGFLCYNNTITLPKRGATPAGFGIKTNYTKGLQIYNNTILIDDNDDNTAWAFAVELWNTSDGCDMYSNTFRGVVNFAGSFTKKGSSTYSIRFHNNFVGHTSLQSVARIGMILENQSDMSDVYIYDNEFKNLQTGITLNTLATSVFNGINIYRNTFYSLGVSSNNYWGNFFTSLGSAGFIMSYINIWNNSFVSGRGANQLKAIMLPTKGTLSNVSIKNNIFTDFGSAYIGSSTETTGSINYVYLQYNDVYNCGASNEPVWGGITPSNLTKTNIIKVNPLFVSTTDFHLQVGSPCINAGVNVGLPYSGIAPDLGYAESNY